MKWCVNNLTQSCVNIKAIGKFFIFENFLKIYLFIYFRLRWVFVAARRLSLVAASGGYSVVVCGLLIAVPSLVAEHRLWARAQ